LRSGTISDQAGQPRGVRRKVLHGTAIRRSRDPYHGCEGPYTVARARGGTMTRTRFSQFHRLALLAVTLAATLALGAGRAWAQMTPSLLNLGSLPATSSTWNFDSDDHIGAGPWQ